MTMPPNQPPHPGQQPEYPVRNPKAEAKAAKAYAKASRPAYKKKRFIIPAAFLALILFSSVISALGGGDGQEAAQPSGSGSATSSAEEDTAPDSTPEAEDDSPKPKPKPKPKTTKARAAAMVKEFEENEAAADAKYAGKLMQVTGIVNGVDTDILDEESYIIELGGGGDYEFIYVRCNDISASVAQKVKKGQKMTVVGQFDDGGDLGVDLADCGPK